MRTLLIILLNIFACTIIVSAQDFQHRIDSNIKTLQLDSIRNIIIELKSHNTKGINRYLLYWEAYANYKCAILCNILKQKKDSEKFIQKAIEQLESIKEKTTEDYALLGMLKNYQINFAGWLTTIKLSNQAKTMAQKAIDINANNLRAYLVLGINNYYTPEMYGGKSKCEEYFKKAISLKNQTSGNMYDPTWGKDDAYYFLLMFYKNRKQEGDLKEFEQIKKDALNMFPSDRRFNRLNY